jgi:hypothetical protein
MSESRIDHCREKEREGKRKVKESENEKIVYNQGYRT